MGNGENELTFHHIGVPVGVRKLGTGAKYSALFKMYSKNCANDLRLRIEWHAFGSGCPLHEKIRKMPHVAFKTANLNAALLGKDILMPAYEPFERYRCAMILLNGMPIELIETSLSEEELWGENSAALARGVLYGSGS
jgi:hypothetical protein